MGPHGVRTVKSGPFMRKKLLISTAALLAGVAIASAQDMGGKLRVPSLSWKYSWARVAFGWLPAKHIAVSARKLRWSLVRLWDKTLFLIESRITPGHSGDLGVQPGSSLPKASA